MKESSDNLNKIEAILHDARNAVSSLGSIKFVQVFDDQADEFKKSIDRWLLVIIAVSVITVFVLTCSIVKLATPASFDSVPEFINSINLEFLPLPLTKVFIVSFLSFLLFQSIRIYNANRHMYSMNKHRANCLRVFEALKEGAHDKSLRDTILSQAVKTIFDFGITGFIHSKDQSSFSVFDATKIINKGHE